MGFGNQVSQVNQVKRLFDRYGGRGGGEPDAGKRSGKNAALDRPAPAGGTEAAESGRERPRRGRRGTERGTKDEQEGLRVFKSQVGGVLAGNGRWSRLGRAPDGGGLAAKGTTALTGDDHCLDWAWGLP